MPYNEIAETLHYQGELLSHIKAAYGAASQMKLSLDLSDDNTTFLVRNLDEIMGEAVIALATSSFVYSVEVGDNLTSFESTKLATRGINLADMPQSVIEAIGVAVAAAPVAGTHTANKLALLFVV